MLIENFTFTHTLMHIVSMDVFLLKGLKNSLAWHNQIFRKFSFVYANAVYEPIRPMLIDLCHDNEIQNVLIEDLF